METADSTGDQIFGAKARGGRRSLLALSVLAQQPISTTDSSFQQSGALLADGYSTGHHEQQNLKSSTSPQTISSITTCSRQGGLSSWVQTTQSPSSTSLDSVPQTYSLLPIAEVPDSSRLSPKARSSVLSYTKLLYQDVTTRKKGTNPTNSRKRRKQLWKNEELLPLLLVLSWITFAWWYLSQSKEAASQILQLSPKVQAENGSSPRIHSVMYERLLSLAANALTEEEFKNEPEDLWGNPIQDGKSWQPCADQRTPGHFSPPEPENSTGYLMISANGGLNQQRVAVCNAVAVARLLNATLVLPFFLFNSVWMDPSQFGDIFQESFFIDYLQDDVRIVKELPVELQSLHLNNKIEVPKEATPSFYLTNILPLLLRARVVHFRGFDNSLSFDPIPFDIQRLRCRCNFHALRFVPKIQDTGDLIIQRMHAKTLQWGPAKPEHTTKYLALHMRFEMDMVAHSLCEFGGGEAEREELRAYRAIHFAMLSRLEQNASRLRENGHCPLMPEEAVLMLVALGFNRGTHLYLAGAHMYGGQSRMSALTNLYPYLATKEDLLTPAELAPFINRSSQLAALDFIGCVGADVFAMTDSGSQLSSLVAGFRTYAGAGSSSTIRPNKKRLAKILQENATVEWSQFANKVRKSVKETKKIAVRPFARSVYRHPRCKECMCLRQKSKNQTRWS
ncbi:unnamed protein product [Sphagnum jensenii]|uniref:O-fucosyltransferase family protein n=1 Tax=Sphagnum jensenii TaxID=128206 RepID=A0ABP1BH42_9BRYO